MTDAAPWRCPAPGCAYRPVLAYFYETGGVYVRFHYGRNRRVSLIVADLTMAPLDCCCPACGSWVRLEMIDERSETEPRIRSGLRPGPVPGVA